MDGTAPIIVAFTSLNLSIWRGNVGASNTSATRIVILPPVPQAQSLALHFGDVVGTIGVVPTEYDTPEKAVIVYRESFKTIPELQIVQSTSTMGGKFRCKGKIIDIDMSRDWCYLGCAVCCKAAVRRDAPFWCEKCDATVHPHQLKQCFRVRLMLHDGSAFAPFVVLGQTAETLLGVSASALFAAAPDRGGGYPPEIECLIGKDYTFLVNLPVGQVSDPMEDFVVFGVEKDEQPISAGKKQYGPCFQKRIASTIATVAEIMPASQQTSLASSSMTVCGSPTKRLRDTNSSISMIAEPVTEETKEFRAPRPMQTLDMSKFVGPSVAAAFNSVLSAANTPATPIKPPESSTTGRVLSNLQSPVSAGLSSPLEGITIATPSSSNKKKEKIGDVDQLESHQLLSRCVCCLPYLQSFLQLHFLLSDLWSHQAYCFHSNLAPMMLLVLLEWERAMSIRNHCHLQLWQKSSHLLCCPLTR
ncbi:unnamed protein product [Linum tenue]|uniref:Replication factor A C-terminal domain-containing protein n=1 Tax=Linum tenue TaxID=586396 RepID=A0AAV0JT78_9ROSI|nr:unnamed protein product [Linum tenue]